MPDLSVRRPGTVEHMDSPECDLAALHRTYRGFGAVNAVVAGWQLTYRSLIRPLAREHAGPFTVVDIGSGGGDLARTLLHRLRRDGVDARVTAVDPDARANAWARVHRSGAGLEFHRGTSRDLVREGRRFDVVLSNHLLHHLDPPQLEDLLADSEALAVRRAVHSDIHRSTLAYALFSVGTAPFFPGSYIRHDGLASIRRSYTPEELAAVVRPGWRVRGQVPWRTLAVWDAGPLAGREGAERGW
ncbi:methyltransferase domain-containing protein [Citricoccus sp. SGAir0253]|uniref:class I SAM-dependent methyltransferase n=1 Tax=Citricoccus sp. SGAir0253 TaxID=2567881 RepID=UPI0010CD501F|nr:class I SAM-dependent methyltransferase [Citricoccus sp. SGAir0253]QCU77524.1 methyltransferase domain-containing protein [Citricoccus sp. SGAir0253]